MKNDESNQIINEVARLAIHLNRKSVSSLLVEDLIKTKIEAGCTKLGLDPYKFCELVSVAMRKLEEAATAEEDVEAGRKREAAEITRSSVKTILLGLGTSDLIDFAASGELKLNLAALHGAINRFWEFLVESQRGNTAADESLIEPLNDLILSYERYAINSATTELTEDIALIQQPPTFLDVIGVVIRRVLLYTVQVNDLDEALDTWANDRGRDLRDAYDRGILVRLGKIPQKEVLLEMSRKTRRSLELVQEARPILDLVQEDGPIEAGTPEREITVTGHTLDGEPVTRFEPHKTYRLRFHVGSPSPVNLARGDTSVGDIPSGGRKTHWEVTSSQVEFVASLSTIVVTKTGSVWIAEFDLIIPQSGESSTEELGVLIGASGGKVLVTLYAICEADNTRELYRQVTVDLSDGPKVESDTTCVALGHTNLRTTHEWTTPLDHVEISVQNGMAIVSTRGGLNEYGFRELWTATDNLLAGAILRVRDSLEKFRVKWEKYLNDLDPDDIAARLSSLNNWKPYLQNIEGWQPLPNAADLSHRTVFEQVQTSEEWRNLAGNGFALYNSCFPQGTKLRDLIDKLKPSSRIDFDWTNQSGAGWISHVPWVLMHMDPADVTGATLPEPERFLGLRFRIASRAYAVPTASRALGDLESVHLLHLLYWGDKVGDEVASESQWQIQQYRQWRNSHLLPELNPSSLPLPNPKQQIVFALDKPAPAPVALVYFYCHCNVGDGSQPVLRFGNTSQAQDTVKQDEISQRVFPDSPLVFANACTTLQADAHMTSFLEQAFFARGVRGFIGTETKVPIQLASKFGWLFLLYFYRIVDPAPMAAGEALTQARMFLWTQYKNVGGLFYSLVNQYDLYLASNKEVMGLRR